MELSTYFNQSQQCYNSEVLLFSKLFCVNTSTDLPFTYLSVASYAECVKFSALEVLSSQFHMLQCAKLQKIIRSSKAAEETTQESVESVHGKIFEISGACEFVRAQKLKSALGTKLL
jgi:hypothetical protein